MAFGFIYQDKVKKVQEQTDKRPKINPTERLEKRSDPIPDFELKQIGISQMRKILKKIKPSRSHGMDFIDANSIKVAAPLLEDSILHMVNLLISSGKFASLWKIQ